MRTLLTLLTLLLTATAAHATTLTLNGLNQVTGATGVVVDDSVFTITLADGSCTGLFFGCDDEADFLPATEANRLDVQAALVTFLEEVDAQGFGPDDLVGCIGTASQCSVYTPTHFNEPLFSSVQSVLGLLTISGLASGGIQGIDVTQDFAPTEVATWAAVTITPIPEPGTFVLAALGLTALGLRSARARSPGRAPTGRRH